MSTTGSVKHKFHFGIYGILLKDTSIVLIKKNRGPYKGTLDLPGGKPEFGESPLETLVREVLEETGISVYKAILHAHYSTIAQELVENALEKTHHVGVVYRVTYFNDHNIVHDINREDSSGAQWYSLDSLTQYTLSPFAYNTVLDLIKKF